MDHLMPAMVRFCLWLPEIHMACGAAAACGNRAGDAVGDAARLSAPAAKRENNSSVRAMGRRLGRLVDCCCLG